MTCSFESCTFSASCFLKAVNLAAKVSKDVQKLYGDFFVKDKKGIFEYILGGNNDTKLLNIRIFDEPTKRAVYEKQSREAKTKKKSNCSHCAMGHDANKSKISPFAICCGLINSMFSTSSSVLN